MKKREKRTTDRTDPRAVVSHRGGVIDQEVRLGRRWSEESATSGGGTIRIALEIRAVPCAFKDGHRSAIAVLNYRGLGNDRRIGAWASAPSLLPSPTSGVSYSPLPGLPFHHLLSAGRMDHNSHPLPSAFPYSPPSFPLRYHLPNVSYTPLFLYAFKAYTPPHSVARCPCCSRNGPHCKRDTDPFRTRNPPSPDPAPPISPPCRQRNSGRGRAPTM